VYVLIEKNCHVDEDSTGAAGTENKKIGQKKKNSSSGSGLNTQPLSGREEQKWSKSREGNLKGKMDPW